MTTPKELLKASADRVNFHIARLTAGFLMFRGMAEEQVWKDCNRGR
jgi:hypothetical protein